MIQRNMYRKIIESNAKETWFNFLGLKKVCEHLFKLSVEIQSGRSLEWTVRRINGLETDRYVNFIKKEAPGR